MHFYLSSAQVLWHKQLFWKTSDPWPWLESEDLDPQKPAQSARACTLRGREVSMWTPEWEIKKRLLWPATLWRRKKRNTKSRFETTDWRLNGCGVEGAHHGGSPEERQGCVRTGNWFLSNRQKKKKKANYFSENMKTRGAVSCILVRRFQWDGLEWDHTPTDNEPIVISQSQFVLIRALNLVCRQ